VPVKYPGLDPWQIWISESQERMTMSIPPEKVDAFMELMKRRGVEAWVVGEFNDSGKCEVTYNGDKIMDLELSFLHDGLPPKTLTTTYTKVTHDEPNMECPADLTDTLNTMMGRLNLASFEFVSHQYDHVVQGEMIVGPFHGKGKVNGHASVMAPVLDSTKGVVVSQAINAKYSDIDTYHMAACAIDSAIRNVVSIGGPLDHLALMDNFCWCSSNEEERLGQLKEAARGCYDFATAYGTPFISGKDSMFNDFKGYDEDGNSVKISVPPTLLVSSLAVMPDYRKTVTLDVKFPGDLVYVVGETSDELGASEYFEELGFIGNNIPKVDAKKNMKVYRAVERAISEGLVVSCESVLLGGLGVALARKSIAGQLGLDISLENLPVNGEVSRPDYLLFSESQGRLVMSVNPSKKDEFEALFTGLSFAQIGTVREDEKFVLKGLEGQTVIDTDVATLDKNYRLTFKGF
jgi:phosphoribosylformylglycinamidine synthase subunit PurSL